jgi:hypothetical protein
VREVKLHILTFFLLALLSREISIRRKFNILGARIKKQKTAYVFIGRENFSRQLCAEAGVGNQQPAHLSRVNSRQLD